MRIKNKQFILCRRAVQKQRKNLQKLAFLSKLHFKDITGLVLKNL